MSECISTYEGMEQLDVPCRNCGTPVRALIEKGARPPRKLCHRCHHHRHFDVDCPDRQRDHLAQLARYAFRCWGQHGPVQVFRPGDPGFATRAKQVQI